MSQVELVDGLPSLDIDGLVSYIKDGHASKIIIMQGAGISCAAGIPDFRSPETGLYHNLQKFNLPCPEAIFSIDYFRDHPEPFFQLAKDTMPGKYKPTLAHYLPVILHRHGLLLRVYTQNIDGLERVTGLPPDMIVEAHGTYFTGHCQNKKCNRKYKFEEFKEALIKGEIARCKDCNGIIKPDIVFYGEALPRKFLEKANEDFPKCDLLIVIGTSLVVYPFAGLIEGVSTKCPRVLINNEMVATYKENLKETKDKDGNTILYDPRESKNLFKFNHKLNKRDIYLGGDCQDRIKELVDKLGWTDEFDIIRDAK